MNSLPQPEGYDQPAVLRWTCKYTDACGWVGPIGKARAEALAEQLRQLFSDYDYSVEPA